MPLVVPLAPPASADDEEADQEGTTEALPGDPWGDTQGLGVISLRGLFQTRYTTTFAEQSRNSRVSQQVKEENLVEQGDGWAINRMLVRLSSDPIVYVGFKAVFDLAELFENDPEDSLKQAYATFRPIPGRLELVVGLFKIPFSILELDPSSRYEFVDMGPSNDLVNDLGFGGRDLGAQLMVAPLKKKKRLRLSAGVFRGHAYDEHDSPAGTFAARAELKPFGKELRLGGSYVEHFKGVDYKRPFNDKNDDVLPEPPDPFYPNSKNWGQGRAFGADARFKKKRVMARGEFLYGDRVDVNERYGAETFWAAWGLVAYRIDIGAVKLLPAVRAEWLDADREHKKGWQRVLQGGLSVLFLERARLVFEVARTDVGKGTIVLNQPKPLATDPLRALSNTRVSAQLQLEL